MTLHNAMRQKLVRVLDDVRQRREDARRLFTAWHIQQLFADAVKDFAASLTSTAPKMLTDFHSHYMDTRIIYSLGFVQVVKHRDPKLDLSIAANLEIFPRPSMADLALS